ncbi:MAG: hypothetical protein J6V13_03875 [Paludibacteraceae bacterium]|nr:hypothetical protein [Paludibacteraceae bacterium]
MKENNKNKEVVLDPQKSLDVLLGNYQLLLFIKHQPMITTAVINVLHNICVSTPEQAYVMAQPIRAYANKIQRNLKQPAILQQTIDMLDEIIAYQHTKDEEDDNAIYDYSLLLVNAASQACVAECDLSEQIKEIIDTLENLLKASIDTLTKIVSHRNKT